MNNKGFSAIELLAVIIILTIITLISIPIVLNIVNYQKKLQSMKSIDAYAENIKIAFDRYKNAHDGLITTEFDELNEYLTIDNTLKCDKIIINDDGSVYISDCFVDGNKVLNDKGESYQYSTK